MATTTEEPPKKTAEELEAEKLEAAPQADKDILADFSRDLLGQPKEKPPEPEKPKEPVKSVKPKAKVPVKPVPAAEIPQIDHEALAEAVGRGVATAMAPKAEPKPEPKDEFEELPEKERRKIPVLQQLEVMDPNRYKGLAKAYAENLKAVVKYQEKWEQENPDKEFDPEAEEHNAFFAKHVVDWDDDDYINATVELRTKKIEEQVQAKSSERLSAIEKREQAREFEPRALMESKRSARLVFNALDDPQFKDLVAENGAINQAQAQKIVAEDPMAADIIFPEVVRIEQLCAESFRLHNGIADFDRNNHDHVYLANFAAAQEAEIQSLPKPQQLDEKGRKFATAADYHRMTPEQQAKHYRLSAQDLNNLLAADLGAKAKAKLVGERTRLEQMAKKYGYSKGGAPAPGTPETPPETELETDKPLAVTTTGVPVASAGANAKDHKPINPEAALAQEWLR
jgi:hypothetical protein